MSYVVCSNSTDDNEVLQGIASANSFQNHFRSPLEIEANSEIAVESVKINRADKFDIVANDSFFIYFGEELSSSNPSGSTTTNAVEIRVPVGSYDRNSMAVALQNAINKAPINPAFNGSAVVSVKSDANGLFAGFTFSFTSASRTDAIDYGNGGTDPSRVAEGNAVTIARNLDFVDADTPLKKQFEFTEVGSVLNCCQTRSTALKDYSDDAKVHRYFASECCARFQVPPLANACGLCVFDLQSKEAMSNDSWFCGLSRPVTPYSNYGYPYYLTQTGQNSGAKNGTFLSRGIMADYWVEFSNACATTGGRDRLIVKHWGKQKDPKQWLPTEVEYYKDGASPFNAFTDGLTTAGILANSLRYVIFELCGNQLKLYLSQTPTITAGKTFFLVDSAQATSGANASLNFPPLGNSEEFLHPVIALTKIDQKIALVDFETFDIPNFSFPTTGSFRINPNNNIPKPDNPIISGTDWWSQSATSARGQKEIRFNELRPSTLWYRNPDAVTNYQYKNLNASGTIDYLAVIIPSQETFNDSVSQYKQALYVIPISQNKANMGRLLGFQTFPHILQSIYGLPTTSAGSVVFSSLNAGEFAVSSCFVRINDLTIRSYNGAKSSRSQILYHIPRFTNDGKQYGELYFTAPEKTYLKLNNTEKMILNNIKIDIVDRNEVVVGDLQGSTIVALHIKQSK